MSKTFVIAQGGGPTAVINQTMVGAALEARKRYPASRVLGALHGVRGIRDGSFVALHEIPIDDLKRIADTPSAALGSTRDKPDAAYTAQVLEGLKKVQADVFINIGGNDTSGTQQILTEAAEGSMVFMHAPKTIDNDLMENDHTPGFMSAGAFVAGAFKSIDLDFRALPGVYVGIVMGRHAGFLTAASAAWCEEEGEGPHLIYVPERPFSTRQFIDDVKRTLDRHKRCVVAVSEGVTTADGKALVESLVSADRLERDQHGNIKLSGSDLNRAFEMALADGLPGQRARVDALGYVPRGYIGSINRTDAREAFKVGAFAVKASQRGDASIALKHENGKTRFVPVPLGNVAAKTRHMPPGFLDAHGTHLSSTGRDYFARLIPARFKTGKPFV